MRPKHKLVFDNADHWDYLPADETICGSGDRGSCAEVGIVTADVITMFLGKYLPPQVWGNLPGMIPDSLVPLNVADLDLTNKQLFYSGSYLTSMGLIKNHPECTVTFGWDVAPGKSGSVVKP